MAWHAGYPVRLFSGLYTWNTESSNDEGIDLPLPYSALLLVAERVCFAVIQPDIVRPTPLIEEPDQTSDVSGGS